jgi:4-aminobutyrate aminotransferase
MKAQLDILPFSPRRYTNKTAIALAAKLVSLLPPALNRVLFAPGGTTAVGMALKLARRVTGKHKVVSVQGSFHGASLDAIAVGGEEQFRKYMGQLYPETIFIPQADSYRNGIEQELQFTEMLDEVLSRNEGVGAFIAETIRNTDVQIPAAGFWQRVREICDRHNVLLILDEIPIAFGRTGTLFAFEQYGIVPDILCLGKGLGAGAFPMAAIVTKEEYNIAGDVALGHYTHEKSPLGAAAALAMIDYTIQQNLLEKVMEDEAFVLEELEAMKADFPIIGDIRGKGLLWAIELVKDPLTRERAVEEAEQVMYACLRNGLSFKVSQGNVLQLCPPLIITREEISAALLIIRQAIQSVLS